MMAAVGAIITILHVVGAKGSGAITIAGTFGAIITTVAHAGAITIVHNGAIVHRSAITKVHHARTCGDIITTVAHVGAITVAHNGVIVHPSAITKVHHARTFFAIIFTVTHVGVTTVVHSGAIVPCGAISRVRQVQGERAKDVGAAIRAIDHLSDVDT